MILHVESGNFLAGNACVIKPSELTVASSNLLAELIPRYLDNVNVTIITKVSCL